MKTVLFQGSFEVVNGGHIKSFALAKAQGDFLIVALNTNKLVWSYKKRRPVLPWREKTMILRSIRYVDKVIPAPEFSPMKLLRKYRPDVFVVGSEWVKSKKAEIAFVRSYGGKIHVSPRFKGITATRIIKARLLAEAQGL